MSADILFACLHRPAGRQDAGQGDDGSKGGLAALAQDFSPRFEAHRDDLVVVDVSGLRRLLGLPREIGEELQRAAMQRGVRAQLALAGTWTAAVVLAGARPGLTVVPRGTEAGALASLPISVLDNLHRHVFVPPRQGGAPKGGRSPHSACNVESLTRWGIRTLGELAAIPAASLASRLGQAGVIWQTLARGEDIRPLVPSLEAERFESSLELEWPIEGLEPMSFVLTRLLEPLSTRLERRDRGAAVLHVVLRLVTRQVVLRSLQLPTPMRDVRTLRTLALLNLESQPLDAAVDRVQVVIDPTPARVVQHTFFARPHPTPEQLSTLLARLNALMGSDRVGAAATVDSYRPGAFEMKPFATEHAQPAAVKDGDPPHPPPRAVVSALRRCRQPVPARVALVDGRPVRVTTDRRGFAGGAVRQCAGPWRTSGAWWNVDQTRGESCSYWNREEWDVALSDGAVYRIFQDNTTDAWFIDAIVD